MSKYTVKVDDGGKQYDETVEVDTKEKTETFHIPSTGSSSAGEVDAIYDFEKVNFIIREEWAGILKKIITFSIYPTFFPLYGFFFVCTYLPPCLFDSCLLYCLVPPSTPFSQDTQPLLTKEDFHIPRSMLRNPLSIYDTVTILFFCLFTLSRTRPCTAYLHWRPVFWVTPLKTYQNLTNW